MAQRSKLSLQNAASFALRAPRLAAEMPVRGAVPRHPAIRQSHTKTEVDDLRQGRRWFVVGQGRLQSFIRPHFLLRFHIQVH